MLEHMAGRPGVVGDFLRSTKFPFLSPQIYGILKAIIREFEEFEEVRKQVNAAERRALLEKRKGKR